MNEWDPRENPIVQRALRTGFRSGPSSFRINWWITGLLVVAVGPFFPRLFNPRWDIEDSMTWMFRLVFALLVLAFLVGGFQRMLSAFSNERERGTFEFLHLSTMRSDGIVAGFLMSGQLPGYFAMVLLAPLLVVSSIVMGYSLPALAVLLGAVVLYVLFVSVLMLYLGYLSKKVAELRSAALIYVVLYFLFASFVFRGFDGLGVLPPEWGDILHGFPFLQKLYYVVTGIEGPNAQLFQTIFFGWSLPYLFALVLVLGPPTVLLFLTLSRSLRYREGLGWSELHAVLFFGWINFLLLGIWWDSKSSNVVCIQTLLIVTWFCMTQFFRRNANSRGGTVLALGRRDGKVNFLSADTGACPPYRLLLLLFLVHLLSFVLLWSFGDSVTGFYLPANALFAPLLLVLPLLLYCSLIQWLAWRVPSWIGGEKVLSALFIWAPYVVYLTAGNLPFHDVLGDSYTVYSLISPFVQAQQLLAGPAGHDDLIGLFGFQLLYAVGALVVFVSVFRYWRVLNKRRDQLSTGVDLKTGWPESVSSPSPLPDSKIDAP